MAANPRLESIGAAMLVVVGFYGCAHQQLSWHKPSATSPLRRNYNASELRAQCLRARGWVLR